MEDIKLNAPYNFFKIFYCTNGVGLPGPPPQITITNRFLVVGRGSHCCFTGVEA